MKKKIIALSISLVLLNSGCTYVTQGLAIDEQRNADVDTDDFFGDSIQEITYLEQNWDRYDSLWFYNTTQGSDLIPYSIYLNLEQADNIEPFRSDANMRKLRFLVQNPSFDNPDGLAVGFVKDTYQGNDYVGLTCAACHTNQINYGDVGMRIDGAPALSDLEGFLINITSALTATLADPEKLARLSAQVIEAGDTENNETFKQQLTEIITERQRYDRRNAPVHPQQGNVNVAYGYGRLDAFGRIFNRVLGHLVQPEIDNANPANAPVSFPFLWDTPYSDFVQWNGVGNNYPGGTKFGFLGPLSRNVGEVLGVFATFDLMHKGKVGYVSSANNYNLTRLEHQLNSLESPLWPEQILPPINQSLAAQGKQVFMEYECAACHTSPEKFDRTDTSRVMEAEHTSVKFIGTDPIMAQNALTRMGLSGVFEGLEIDPDKNPGQKFAEKTSAVVALKYTTPKVTLEPDQDKLPIRRWVEQASNFLFARKTNPFKEPTQRHVNFEVIPESTDPKVIGYSLMVYRGRALNGIWATAPYLHNGSVPNLYELFLPSCSDAEISAGKDCRSNRFTVGSRAFDPVNVGFVSKSKTQYPDLYEFDTALPSNSNVGHEYAAGITPMIKRDAQGAPMRDAEGNFQQALFPAMNHQQRLALVEYLKTL